jgi:hypothetical protein
MCICPQYFCVSEPLLTQVGRASGNRVGERYSQVLHNLWKSRTQCSWQRKQQRTEAKRHSGLEKPWSLGDPEERRCEEEFPAHPWQWGARQSFLEGEVLHGGCRHRCERVLCSVCSGARLNLESQQSGPCPGAPGWQGLGTEQSHCVVASSVLLSSLVQGKTKQEQPLLWGR